MWKTISWTDDDQNPNQRRRMASVMEVNFHWMQALLNVTHAGMGID